MHHDELTGMREDLYLKLFTRAEKSGAQLVGHA